jgi:hypothetical protein
MPGTRRARSRSAGPKGKVGDEFNSSPRGVPKEKVGHILGQEDLAKANIDKVARFSPKNFPGVVELGVAGVASLAAATVISLVTVYSFSDFVVFRASPLALGYIGGSELYGQLGKQQDFAATSVNFLYVLYAHFSWGLCRKSVSHIYQAVHSAIFCLASYKLMHMLGDPFSTLSHCNFSMGYVQNNMMHLATIVGAASGAISFVGHVVSPYIDSILSPRRC